MKVHLPSQFAKMHSQSASKKHAPEPEVSERPKRLRRWFRIRIWHLLLLLTLVAIPLGTIVQSARTEYEAFKKLRDSELFEMELSDPPEFASWFPRSLREAYGGLIFQDVIQLSCPESFPKSEEEREFVPVIAKLQNIQRLFLDTSYLGSTEIVGFQNKDSLNELSLSQAVVVPESLAKISTFASLETLWLDSSTILGENLFTQERFPKLRVILADSSMLVDEAVLDIADLPLTKLKLDQTAISPRAFERLDMMQELDSLSLRGVRLDLATCERIGRLPKLRSLDIDSTAVSDEMLGEIARPNSSIEELNISCCEQVSDAAIELLLAMPRLASLDVSGTSISVEGLARLAGHPTLDNLDLDDEQISWQLLEHFEGTMIGQMGRSEIDDRLLKNPTFNDGSLPIVDFFEITPQLPVRRDRHAMLPAAQIVQVQINDASPSEADLQEFFSKFLTANLDVYDSAFSTEHLPKYEYLCGLSLQNTEVTDELFAKLNRYPHLWKLDLAGNQKLTGEGFSDWKLPKELNSLVLRDLTLTRQDVKRLVALTKLEELYFRAEPDVEILLDLLQASIDLDLRWRPPANSGEVSEFFYCDNGVVGMDLADIGRAQLEQLLSTARLSQSKTVDLYNASLEQLETFNGQVNWYRLSLVDPQDSVLSKRGAELLASLTDDVSVRTTQSVNKLAEFAQAARGNLRLDCKFDGSEEDVVAINRISGLENVELEVRVPNFVALERLLEEQLDNPEDILVTTEDALDSLYYTPSLATIREWCSTNPLPPMERSVVVLGGLASAQRLDTLKGVFSIENLFWFGEVSPSHLKQAFVTRELQLNNCRITNELVQIMSKFPWLRSVIFTECTFEESCLAKLEQAWSLRDVSFFVCQFKDEEVIHSLRLGSGRRRLFFDSCNLSSRTSTYLTEHFGPNVEVHVWD